jgi:hypothetical protein
MKLAAQGVLACLSLAVLAVSGCNYVKPMMYLNVANHSGRAMENIELKYPGGSFGLPELRNEQTHRHMVPIGAPCKFGIEFEDQAGKKYVGNFDLGTKCPTEISFEVGAGMSVTEKLDRP